MSTITFPDTITDLDRAVLRQLAGGDGSPDAETLREAREAAEHGADAGWCGFVYHKDTVPFYEVNRWAILRALMDMADDCGETPSAMLAGFYCIKNAGIADPMAALAAGPDHEDYAYVASAMAWFALDGCGRRLLEAEEAEAQP